MQDEQRIFEGSIEDLSFDTENPRKRTQRSAGLIKESLEQVGFCRSIVVDEHGRVLVGNGTLEEAAQLGMTRVVVVPADGNTVIAVQRAGLSKQQKKALTYYDNRAGELSTWDPVQIAEDELAGLDRERFFTEGEHERLLRSLPNYNKGGEGGGGTKENPQPPEEKAGDRLELKFAVLVEADDEEEAQRLAERLKCEGMNARVFQRRGEM